MLAVPAMGGAEGGLSPAPAFTRTLGAGTPTATPARGDTDPAPTEGVTTSQSAGGELHPNAVSREEASGEAPGASHVPLHLLP